MGRDTWWQNMRPGSAQKIPCRHWSGKRLPRGWRMLWAQLLIDLDGIVSWVAVSSVTTGSRAALSMASRRILRCPASKKR
jgi:hypothetical protein